jgi:hypothetical protein
MDQDQHRLALRLQQAAQLREDDGLTATHHELVHHADAWLDGGKNVGYRFLLVGS